jgi:hypothetical protein
MHQHHRLALAHALIGDAHAIRRGHEFGHHWILLGDIRKGRPDCL